MDVDGRIIDLKTAKKAPGGVRPDYRRQLATYSYLAQGTLDAAKLDTLTKTKTVKLHEQTITITPADRRGVEKLYPLAQAGMRSGLYFPNRGSMLCGKYCSYREQCVVDFGGEVAR